MKKKILAMLLAMTLFPMGTAYAENIYFQSELGTIEELLVECDKKNIDTPYEDLGYNVLKMFSEYIEEDEAQGVDATQLTYNKEYMTKLYSEIKANLESYLLGEVPTKVVAYDMSQFDDFKSNGRSVYSIGYGHGIQVRSGVEKIDDLGATNMQFESGPTMIFTELPSFTPIKYVDTASYTVENNAEHGNYVSITNTGTTGGLGITQKIYVEPNTTYTYGFSAKTSISDAKIIIRITDQREEVLCADVNGEWTNYEYVYTTGSDETEVEFALSGTGTINDMFFDDLFFKDGDGNNLLFNGNFEDEYDKKEIEDMKRDVERAYANNVTVCLLLSPHKFPDDLDVEGMYTDKDNGFIDFNIDLPQSKKIVEDYLRILLEEIKDCKGISSICLTNEPKFVTFYWYDYYAPKFTEWLKTRYTDISELNKAYGTQYATFEDIKMPETFAASPMVYDWVQFNDEVFLEWHEWLAGIVREYFPNTPLHAKTMKTISLTNPYGSLCYPKPEVFDSFSNWTGTDSVSFFKETDGTHSDYSNEGFLLKMLWYDFLFSTTGKPIYNSEDHIIQDQHDTFDEKYAIHSRADLWQGMMHHNKMSTVWVWHRTYDEDSEQYNSILHRPDCVYEIGRTALDLNRLSADVDTITTKKPKVAIFYSQSSRNYTSTFCEKLLEIYTHLVSLGQTVGFVMETDTSKLSEYDILVAGNAYNTTPEAAVAIKNFIKDGGTVINLGNSFIRNQYNQATDFEISGMISADSSTLKTVLTEELEKRDLMRVKLIDNATGEMMENVDWSFVINDDELLINILPLEGNKTFSVQVDGEVVYNIVNVLENEVFTGTTEEYVPILLKKTYGNSISEKVKDVYVDGNVVSWDSNDSAYDGANIYCISNNELKLVGTTPGFLYTAGEDEHMLIIKAYDAMGNESEGVSVGIYPEVETYISGGRAYVKNITNKAQAGVLSVSLIDEDGEVLQRSQVSFILRPKEIQSMKITIAAVKPEHTRVVEVLETINN